MPGTEIVTVAGVMLTSVASGGEDYEVDGTAIRLARPADPADVVSVAYVPNVAGSAGSAGFGPAAVPAEVSGTGRAGTSSFAARGDHAHGLGAGTIALSHLAPGTPGMLIGFGDDGWATEVEGGVWGGRKVDLTAVTAVAGINWRAISPPRPQSGPGAVVMDGPDVGPPGVVYGPYRAHQISLGCDGPVNGVDFRIVGIGIAGEAVEEVIAGPGAAAAIGTRQYFTSVSKIEASAGFSANVWFGRDRVAMIIDPALGLSWYLPYPVNASTPCLDLWVKPWRGSSAVNLDLTVQHAASPQDVTWRSFAPHFVQFGNGVPERPAARATETFLLGFSPSDAITAVRISVGEASP